MIAVSLPDAANFEAWRAEARRLIGARTPPEAIAWRGEAAPDLFGETLGETGPTAPAYASRAFIEIARKAVLHRDEGRFALLYRVLWRLQTTRNLMEDAADADVAQLNALAKAVRRDEHKMHAFVRFKEIETPAGPRFVAWFEPQHHILRESADFFVRRFTGMAWSILTPEESAHWDGAALSFGPGGTRADAPMDDARDEDWRVYYQNMFNPARLKVAAMMREMPKFYWKNLPEAQDIQGLIRAASMRAQDMVIAAPTEPRKRAGAAHARIMPATLAPALEGVAQQASPPNSIEELNKALGACRGCTLWSCATQAVAGEGPIDQPRLALVGEQPGDQEDLAGKPFVGPAGQMLDRALAAAGIVRAETYVTNAVKHFKHEARGKRRLHKRPDSGEIEKCRWWVTNEIRLVRPKLVVALGATALQSLTHHKGSLESARGMDLATREGAALRATIHPSYILRLPDAAAQRQAFDRFVEDLRAAAIAAARDSSGSSPRVRSRD